jgi:hypothetical protein
MDGLREKIAEIIGPWMEDRDYLAGDVAEQILALPELADAPRPCDVCGEPAPLLRCTDCVLIAMSED